MVWYGIPSAKNSLVLNQIKRAPKKTRPRKIHSLKKRCKYKIAFFRTTYDVRRTNLRKAPFVDGSTYVVCDSGSRNAT